MGRDRNGQKAPGVLVTAKANLLYHQKYERVVCLPEYRRCSGNISCWLTMIVNRKHKIQPVKMTGINVLSKHEQCFLVTALFSRHTHKETVKKYNNPSQDYHTNRIWRSGKFTTNFNNTCLMIAAHQLRWDVC